MQTKSDHDLLLEYTGGKSEAAFGEIVRRYADFVYSAALRQVGDVEQARDVAQMVFVDLARKAGSLRANTVLIGWLCQGARLAALEQLRKDQRRQHRERQAMESFDPAPETPDDWNSVRPVLDAAIASLDHADRDALLLRFFKNESLSVVGTALGVSEDAAQKRVFRALDKLRDFLAGRGIRTTAAALSVALAANTVQAAPAGFASKLAAGALVNAAVIENSTIPFLKLVSLNMKSAIVFLALAGGLAVVTVSQVNARRQLDEARALVRQQTDEIANLRLANEEFAAQAAELERLRGEMRDLPRLRGEVARLRQPPATRAAALPAAPTEANSQTNISGPELLIQAKFVSLPRPALSSLSAAGLPYLHSGVVTVLSDSQVKLIIAALEGADDAAVLSNPRVTTRSGLAASVAVMQSAPLGDTNVNLGLQLELVPEFSGSVFDLDLTATLNQLVDLSAQRDGTLKTVETTEARAHTQLVEGQTVVLVKDIPTEGWLGIGPTNNTAGPKTLLVFVTPSVVTPSRPTVADFTYHQEADYTYHPVAGVAGKGDTNTFNGDVLRSQKRREVGTLRLRRPVRVQRA